MKKILSITPDNNAGAAETSHFPVDTGLIKDDLYLAVNGAWLKQAQIPADHSQTGGFMDLRDGIEKTLMADFAKLLTGDLTPANPEMAQFKAFYALASDFKQRERLGSAPLRDELATIEALTSLADLDAQLTDWVLAGRPLPLTLSVDADMKNTKVYALFADAPNLFLPDKTYYAEDNQAGKQLLAVFTQMSQQLLVLAGYTTTQAATVVQQATDFDALMAPHVKSAEEAADYAKMYNPRSYQDVVSSTDQLDLDRLIRGLIHTQPAQVIVPQPAFLDFLPDLLTAEHFEQLKSWMIVKTVNALSRYLTEEFRQTGGLYSKALSGQRELQSPEKAAFYLATGVFSQVVGDYYGRTYFGEQAKQDVHDMVVKMVNVYQQRLTTNDWLSQATRDKAILKLQHLGIQVGYPDKIDPLFKRFIVTPTDQGGTLLSNVLAFNRMTIQDEYDRFDQPVDRTRWEMSADTVNAYYHPFHNIIVFPAAILQAPFYSLQQSSSANFGGIGAVIAHEISHAFDNNGALFDEYGNLNNWWTDTDRAHFQERADHMISEFEGLPFAGQTVNGKLTVSENIADAGGLSCALEAAKGEADVDLVAFFENWAAIWRMKATTEYMQLLLSIDVHAPTPLRANVQVKNLADFYSTFHIQPGDGMYLAPDKRVAIW